MSKPMETMSESRALSEHAAELLTSVKGIEKARVQTDKHGVIVRLEIVPCSVNDRAAARNAQSALMAVLGVSVDVNSIVVVDTLSCGSAQEAGRSVDEEEAPQDVIELKAAVRPSDLNLAAKTAFETLRAAQSIFHGFQFDGAELVKIAGHSYVVVAIKRAASEGRYCGASPVMESVSTASARALMNAVGVAAMAGNAKELVHFAADQIVLEA